VWWRCGQSAQVSDRAVDLDVGAVVALEQSIGAQPNPLAQSVIGGDPRDVLDLGKIDLGLSDDLVHLICGFDLQKQVCGLGQTILQVHVDTQDHGGLSKLKVW
jgi:hypothetical protein